MPQDNYNLFSSLEMCAGAGGQALGLEQAGFGHEALVEIEAPFCETLRMNRPEWSVFESDLNSFSGLPYKGVDLLAGGLPCPPFSIAGKQLGKEDERDCFPAALRLADEIRPQAIMIENVRGLLGGVFGDYRQFILKRLNALGYHAEWRLFNASDFGVPQLRPRSVLVGIKKSMVEFFDWPEPGEVKPLTVGETLRDLMADRGWAGAEEWSKQANRIAPTVVGGSKKHGGPDLGPTRAKRQWAELGVNGLTLAEEAPDCDFEGMPRLTVRMVARLQGFPDSWQFSGRKTVAYRQVGNAFPPPVARAVAERIMACLTATRSIAVAAE
ncbi:MAG: DNA cytosine methyltransferase [Spartobacteria bacterium]|nr:DNA cytosine methyltransferase [Spartobacteria bacterium]